MSPTSRPIVYSLLTVVVVLLLGIVTLLRVADQRNRRLEDQRIDLQRSFYRQESQIKELKVRLEDCDTLRTNTPISGSSDTLGFSEFDTDLIPVDALPATR